MEQATFEQEVSVTFWVHVTADHADLGRTMRSSLQAAIEERAREAIAPFLGAATGLVTVSAQIGPSGSAYRFPGEAPRETPAIVIEGVPAGVEYAPETAA